MNGSTTERGVKSVYAGRALACLSLLFAIASAAPVIMAAVSALGAVFMFVWGFCVIIFLILLFAFSALTLFFIWLNESFRNYAGSVASLLSDAGALDRLASATASVFAAYKVICPLFAAISAALGVAALIISIKSKPMYGASKVKVKAIVCISLSVASVIAYYALSAAVFTGV